MVEEYRIRYCLFLTAIMIASDSWLNLFKNGVIISSNRAAKQEH